MSQAQEPGPWELQRAIERVDADRRSDVSRIEERHLTDRAELLGYLDALADRLERTIRESAGVPLATWQTQNEAVDRELKHLRERVDTTQKVLVGALITLLLGGLGAAVGGVMQV